ncbi:hypothetical protein F2Q69_00007076 [Brassica cretica]|uniref:Uncharacterized protein n=1 Tax=Brassica cretica TaxID=69181 RepID=A0A8S9P447_BRACR|nr:hypothetical protein F2Q69_00007076 [Brassica cretica]
MKTYDIIFGYTDDVSIYISGMSLIIYVDFILILLLPVKYPSAITVIGYFSKLWVSVDRCWDVNVDRRSGSSREKVAETCSFCTSFCLMLIYFITFSHVKKFFSSETLMKLVCAWLADEDECRSMLGRFCRSTSHSLSNRNGGEVYLPQQVWLCWNHTLNPGEDRFPYSRPGSGAIEPLISCRRWRSFRLLMASWRWRSLEL